MRTSLREILLDGESAINARCPTCRFLLEFQAQFDLHRAVYEGWRSRDVLKTWYELGIGACIGKLVIFPCSIWTSFSDAWRNQLKRCAPADRETVNNAFEKVSPVVWNQFKDKAYYFPWEQPLATPQICKNMIIDIV